MLFLLFQLGKDHYAIEARKVVEVLPLATLKQLPHAPTGIAGVLNYRGEPLPVVDLCALTLSRPAALRISTRLLVVEISGNSRLGLIAEHANGTIKRNPEDFEDSGVKVADAPYLGKVVKDGESLVQWIDPELLLSREVREALALQLEPAA